MKLLRSFQGWTLLLALMGSVLIVSGETNLTAQEKPEQYTVDKVHSSVLFKVKHANSALFYGRFIELSGDITFDRDTPSKSSIDLTVQADSVRTWNQKRDDHLRSPDFLNAKQFPEITFTSKKVKKIGRNTYQVTGDFTLHGEPKQMTVDVEKTGEGKGPEGNPRIGFHTTFEIKRSAFGMSKYLEMIGDSVTLIVSVEGVHK